jgi:hypothetical protein
MPLSEVHEQIKDVTRRFANQVIRPAAEALDRDEPVWTCRHTPS